MTGTTFQHSVLEYLFLLSFELLRLFICVCVVTTEATLLESRVNSFRTCVSVWCWLAAWGRKGRQRSVVFSGTRHVTTNDKHLNSQWWLVKKKKNQHNKKKHLSKVYTCFQAKMFFTQIQKHVTFHKTLEMKLQPYFINGSQEKRRTEVVSFHLQHRVLLMSDQQNSSVYVRAVRTAQWGVRQERLVIGHLTLEPLHV